MQFEGPYLLMYAMLLPSFLSCLRCIQLLTSEGMRIGQLFFSRQLSENVFIECFVGDMLPCIQYNHGIDLIKVDISMLVL